jgi:hypothetical protein
VPTGTSASVFFQRHFRTIRVCVERERATKNHRGSTGGAIGGSVGNVSVDWINTRHKTIS